MVPSARITSHAFFRMGFWQLPHWPHFFGRWDCGKDAISSKNSSGTPLIEWTIFPLMSTPDASRRVLEEPVIFPFLLEGFFFGLRDGDGEEDGDTEGDDDDGSRSLTSSTSPLALMPSPRSPGRPCSAFTAPFRYAFILSVPIGLASTSLPALAAKEATPTLLPRPPCTHVAVFAAFAAFCDTNNRRRALTVSFAVSKSFSTLHSSSLLTAGRPVDWLARRFFFFRSTGAEMGRPSSTPPSRIP